MNPNIVPGAADEELRALNRQYIDAFMSADVAWYEAHLAGDFVCIEHDGSVLDKKEFLRRAALKPELVEYRLERVDVRLCGNGSDVALVQAQGFFERRDGTLGVSLYTDVYTRRNGAWTVVSAQITRRAKER